MYKFLKNILGVIPQKKTNIKIQRGAENEHTWTWVVSRVGGLVVCFDTSELTVELLVSLPNRLADPVCSRHAQQSIS